MSDRTTQIAKTLRHRMTDSERQLWTQFRAHRLAPWKFKRQQPLGPYIVDFVCSQTHLIIEVDGGQHLDSEPDRIRGAWLEGQGFRVLRFWNNEVLKETPAVLEKILEVLSPLTPPRQPLSALLYLPHPCGRLPPPRPSPTRGEGS